MIRIGIDLGGTKISGVALDEEGRERWRERLWTPQGDYAGTLEAIAQLVALAEASLDTRCQVGIGIPGSVSSRTGLIRNANSTCLNGRELHRDLEARLGRPIRLENDANCLALSEATDGAGAGLTSLFAAILGTGVGGGVVVRGQLLTGLNRIAGEWGHSPLPLPDPDDLPLPACYCGRAGCIETYLSGPGLAADHARRNGRHLDAASIARLAAGGDRDCEVSLQRYEARLARALAGVINLLDPDAIVLGGGLSRLERLYRHIPKLWGAHVFSDAVATPLLPARHGDDSGVRGAANLWPIG